jgi:hypothetical protein
VDGIEIQMGKNAVGDTQVTFNPAGPTRNSHSKWFMKTWIAGLAEWL